MQVSACNVIKKESLAQVKFLIFKNKFSTEHQRMIVFVLHQCPSSVCHFWKKQFLLLHLYILKIYSGKFLWQCILSLLKSAIKRFNMEHFLERIMEIFLLGKIFFSRQVGMDVTARVTLNYVSEITKILNGTVLFTDLFPQIYKASDIVFE